MCNSFGSNFVLIGECNVEFIGVFVGVLIVALRFVGVLKYVLVKVLVLALVFIKVHCVQVLQVKSK